MHYVFTNAAAQVQSINALKVALAARNSSIYKLISRARARAVNVTTLPTTPPNGYVALFNKAPMGIWQTYPAYMAIYIPQVIEGGAWFLVSSDVLGNVAQDYRAAQYRLIVEANGWVETITDSSAEGIGPVGPPGAAGASSEVSKLDVAATYAGGFASGRWISHDAVESGLDNGEVVTGYIPASIHFGHPLIHVVPATGEPYYQILRRTEADANARPPGARINSVGPSSFDSTNRTGGTVVRPGDRIRFIGLCVTSRTIVNAAQNTNVMPFRFCRDMSVRQDELYVADLSSSLRTGAIYNSMLITFVLSQSPTRWHFHRFAFSPRGSTLIQDGVTRIISIPVTSDPRPTVGSTTGPGNTPSATNYFRFLESEIYYTIPS